MCLVVSCSLLLNLISQRMNFEAVEARNELVCWPLGSVLWMNHKQHVREASAEISPVRMMVSGGLGCINIHAFWAVKLDHGLPWHVRQSDGQHGLILTVNPRAVTKVPCLILLNHLCNAPIGQNVSGVNESIQHLRCLLYQVGLVRIILELVIRLQVEDHVECLSVVRDLLVQPS